MAEQNDREGVEQCGDCDENLIRVICDDDRYLICPSCVPDLNPCWPKTIWKMAKRGPTPYDELFGTCRICWHDKRRRTLVEHHVSYSPERTIRVCRSCHSKLHFNSYFRPDLTPEMSRGEAEEAGYIS